MVRLLVCVALLAAAAGAASACPSDFDPGFGEAGVAQPDSALVSSGVSYDVAITSDGGFVLAGISGGTPTLFRYTHDGRLDESFGEGGLAQVEGYGDFNSLAIQDDGSILAAGDIDTPSTYFAVLLARFDASGRLDPDFGDGGTTTIEDGDIAYARDLLVRSDGVIVVTGQGSSSGHGWQPLVFFFTEDGVLDPAFGDGPVRIPQPQSAVATSAVEAGDGAVVVSGIRADSGDTFLAKLTAEGELDPAFGGDGLRAYRSPRKYEEAWRIGRDAEGRIYVSGNTTSFAHITSTRVFVRRVLPDGRRDTSYGNRGRALVRFHRELAPRGLAVSAAGEVTVPAWFVSGSRAFLVRLTPEGERDVTFGNLGIARFRLGAATELHQVVLQDDDRIVATGQAGGRPLLLRLEGGAWDGEEACILPCGDGIVGVREECDDGNVADNDGCSAACLLE